MQTGVAVPAPTETRQNMEQEKLKDNLARLRPQLVEAAQRIIRIPSVKAKGCPGMPFGNDIADCLEYVLSLCGSLGFRTKNCDGFVGYAEVGDGAEMLGILAHLDVVPAGGGWTYPPFGGEIHEGKLYGRGAIDDKGPAVAAVFALKSVLDAGLPLHKRVRLIFGTDEESDWEDMDHYVKYEELPTFGFTPDADFPLIYAEKGILQFDLAATGAETGRANAISGGEAANMVPDSCRATVTLRNGTTMDVCAEGKAAHASTPEDGENAIAKVMERLHAMKANGEIECSEMLARFIDFYHDKIGDCLHGEKINCALRDEQTGPLTMNAGMIDASDEKVSLSIDIRCPVSFSQEEVTGRIGKEAREYGLSMQNIYYLKPVFLDRNSDMIGKLLGVYRRATGDESEPIAMGGGTYARAMDNIVAFGPLFPGREAMEHKRDEFIILEDLYKIADIYADAIRELASE
jgi:succinyl-diaminopimelate desuccinylase